MSPFIAIKITLITEQFISNGIADFWYIFPSIVYTIAILPIAIIQVIYLISNSFEGFLVLMLRYWLPIAHLASALIVIDQTYHYIRYGNKTGAIIGVLELV